MTAYIINMIGLIFDISGIILLYRFGMTAELIKAVDKKQYPEDSKEKIINTNIINKSTIGLRLIVIGFILQFSSTFIQMYSYCSTPAK